MQLKIISDTLPAAFKSNYANFNLFLTQRNKMKQTVKQISLLTCTLVLLASSLTTLPRTVGPTGQLNISNDDRHYTWDETRAKREIDQTVKKKFGTTAYVWGFLSAAEKNKRRMKNQEISKINSLAIREIESPDNFKRRPFRKGYTTYKERVVKKPVRKYITVWEEVKETVPETNFKTVREKRWHNTRLIERVSSAIVQFIGGESYNYAVRKTNNPVVADIVKREMTSEVLKRVKSRYLSLSDYLGQERERKIDEKIRRIMRQENVRANNLQKPTYVKPAPKPAAPVKPNFKTYPSDSCCICLDSFNNKRRVFLKPCGHDICADCFKNYKEQCAICRTKVEGSFMAP